MRLAMDSTFIVGVLSAGVALKNKTDLFINKNFKDKIKAIKTPIKKVLNNNILNKKVIAPVNNAVNKIAKGNRAVLNIAATFVAPTIATAAILRYTAEGKARKQNIEENFSTLKSFQTALKEYDRKNI